MTLGHALLLLLLGSTASIGLFYLLLKFEKSIEIDKNVNKDE